MCRTQETRVRAATPADLGFLDDLQLRNTDAIGFLPAQMWEPSIAAGRVTIVLDNGDPAGYLMRGPIRPTTKVYQCVVRADSREKANGTALARAFQDLCLSHQVETLSLHCAEDLPSNAYWQAMRYDFAGTRDPRGTRGRKHNRWRKHLVHHAKMEAAVLQELHGERTLKILDLLGVKDQFLQPIKKRLRGKR